MFFWGERGFFFFLGGYTFWLELIKETISAVYFRLDYISIGRPIKFETVYCRLYGFINEGISTASLQECLYFHAFRGYSVNDRIIRNIKHNVGDYFWLPWKMWVCVMISVRPAGQVSVCGKKFNITIFSDPVNMIPKVKLCVMVELIELFPFIPLSVTLIVCQGHSTVKQF